MISAPKRAREDLPKKPLVEAIFELRWRLENATEPSSGRDPGFKLLLGKFFDCVRDSYPTLVDLPQAQFPEELLPHVVRHQFRGPDKWPLLQLGPGILTANETTGYTWDSFKPRLSEAIAALYSSYPKDLYQFVPTQVVLRYINAIHLNPDDVPTLLFLRDKLHTQVALDADLTNTVLDLYRPLAINLNLTFPMKTPAGTCSLSFSSGKAGVDPALIWRLETEVKGNDLPADEHAMDGWLEQAHEVIEQWFLSLSRGELLNSFRG